jgi:hypothetical protein
MSIKWEPAGGEELERRKPAPAKPVKATKTKKVKG